MVEGSASVPMASTRASRPLHEQEASATNNKSMQNTRQAFRQQSTHDYRTPRNGRSDNVHHRQYYRSAPYGSPFVSPPVSSKRRPRSSHSRTSDAARKPRPEPLVLDPSASKSLPGHLGACNSEHRRVTISDGRSSGTVQTLFQVAAQGLREHHATAALYSEGSLNLHATPTAIDRTTTAAIFARSSGVVQAGFLQKLGKNIPEFKRRFFVLKPETSLYYYLSPNETEPRGKINLEGSSIEQLEETPDGRFRFVVSWKSDNSDGDRSNADENKEFVLEARSKEIGEEWIQHMKGERVSYLKEKNESLTSTITKQANQIADLERQIEHFRMIEKDRDGALEDAKNWKNKFHRLDEALRLLTQQIRKSVSTSFSKEEGSDDAGKATAEKDAVGEAETANSVNDNETVDSAKSLPKDNAESSHLPETNDDTTPVKKNRAPALLDDLAHEDMDVEEIMDVPGTYFSGLSNACKQQKESSRLASIEASSAVDDVLQANEKVEVIQKRMNKAEKQILKLWEENCDIRNKLKQKKREKRVLVKEVKQLQHTVQGMEENLKQASAAQFMPNKTINEDNPMEDSMIGSDEERLIIELEEHVASSIRLHDRLLGKGFDRDMEQSISTDLASVAREQVPNGNLDSKFRQIELEGSKAKQVSLFDDESDSDDESSVQHQDYEDMNSRIETQSLFGSVASSALSFADSNLGSPPRANPLLELEEDSEREHRLLKPSSSKLVTENGQANSRLVCPLADVVDVSGRSSNGTNDAGDQKGNEDLRVHHLTFYSQKIGIQFQKAAPAPTKPRGLLTDAVTADLVEKIDDSDKTAAELRSVANFTSLARGGIVRQKKESKSSKSSPVDIVLVCGFEGFDDSGANQRPKLGARLVAFDGISVEVGKWTFEKIRKAIKSRGRPLTLSFRNDFLTTEQRATLTQAIKDVEVKRDPVHRKLEYERPPSTTPSLSSAPSFESGNFLNNNNDISNRGQGVHRTGEYTTFKSLDISATATEQSNCWNQCPASSASSISSAQPPHSARSSEAGSTRSMSSLMKILVRKGSASSDLEPGSEPSLKGTKSREEGSKRNRMFDGGINPSGTRQHQDFQANLL